MIPLMKTLHILREKYRTRDERIEIDDSHVNGSTPRKYFIGIRKEESSNKILTYNKINNIHMICTSLGNNINNTNNNRLYNKNSWKILIRKKENSLKHLRVKYFSDGNIFLLVNFTLFQIISNDVHESHRRRKECNIGVDFKKGG